MLAGGGREEVGERVAYAGKGLEVKLRVLLLVVGGLLEDGRDLLISGLLRSRREVGVLVAGHRLAGKSFPQVLLSLASL